MDNNLNEENEKKDSNKSDTNEESENYEPSIGEIMVECDDLVYQGSDDESEDLTALLAESCQPIQVVLENYENVGEKRSQNGDDDENGFKRRCLFNDTYDEDKPENDENSKTNKKKSVNIGPWFQIDIPDEPDFPALLSFEYFDEIIFDPYAEADSTIDDFYGAIRRKFPSIVFCDELIFNLFHKHKGNIEQALNDIETLKKISEEQHAPLTDWNEYDCLVFKDAFIALGKNLKLIHDVYFPDKTMKSVVNVYYIFKKSLLYCSLVSPKNYKNYENQDGDSIKEEISPNDMNHNSDVCNGDNTSQKLSNENENYNSNENGIDLSVKNCLL